MTKASTDSTSVIHRCFQIVPSTNHLTMRAATSAGVEKKNGGGRVSPPPGPGVKSCQSNTVTSATRSWSARSLGRDTRKNLRCHHLRRRMIQQPPTWGMRQDLSLAAVSAMTGCPACAGHDSEYASLRLRERSDD